MNAPASFSRRLARLVLLVTCLGHASACRSPVSLLQPLHEGSRTSTVPHKAGGSLRVVAVNGSVSVSQSERDDVQVAAHLKAVSEERLKAAKVVTYRGDDGSLSISVDWPGGKPLNREGCRFEVWIPDAEGVILRSSNGQIDLAGLGGEADLVTSNGTITVNSHRGPLKATTSNGRIIATGIEGSVDASTSNGEIAVTDATGPVDGTTSNGPVDVSLHPEGPGPIRVRTSNGSVTLALSRALKGQLSLTTSNGSVNVDPDLEPRVVSREKTRAVVDFGESASQSTATTSNGSIHVKIR